MGVWLRLITKLRFHNTSLNQCQTSMRKSFPANEQNHTNVTRTLRTQISPPAQEDHLHQLVKLPSLVDRESKRSNESWIVTSSLNKQSLVKNIAKQN